MNYEQIKPYIQKKLISEQIHPENPRIRIFNYTQSCQFDKAWDEVTMQCRGLIMNIETGEILARPFPKFFNYGEYVSNGWPIPIESPIVTEKLDGSLGIMYFIDGKPYIATRGAFESDQAKWANKWWQKNVGNEVAEFAKNFTHLFEIIYPENRIVVNYDFSGLVYLCSVKISDGRIVEVIMPDKVKTIQKVSIGNNPLDMLVEMDTPNAEGFVIFFPGANKLMKIKFNEYVRLHKLVTGVSEIAIWEHLKEDTELNDLLDKVPDEFFQWVQSVENRLRKEFAELYQEAKLAELTVYPMSSRKEQALWIMANAKKVSGPTFSLLNGDNAGAAKAIWRMIRPHGNSQFKIDTDL